ncbi:type II secretion system F family protein [Gilvimarinus chinensis]|uniref:type II secretion system F family protein n=1 Tax=Gilvimarinus chinensis TaxID=396005 RepID=UPI0003A045C9|nr:type II secretion system F family protein [Gilvimarinus chinensis]
MNLEILLVASCFSVSAAVLAWIVSVMFSRAAVLYRSRFTEDAKVKLSDLFLFVEPEKLFIINLAILFAAFFLVFLIMGSWVIALVISVALSVSPPFIFRLMKRKRQKQFLADLPDMLQATSTAMKSGSSLNQSMESVICEMSGPVRQEFDLFMREVRVGVDFDVALDNLYERIPLIDLNLVISGIKISREIGGNLADTIERMADTLRKKLEMEGKIDALTSQGRAQGYVMTGLPILLGIVLYQMEPEQMSLLWEVWYGWVVIAIVVVLETLGYVFIQKIVNIDV